jgi:syntaxin 1B/2/3
MGQAEQQTYTPVAGMGQQGGAPAAGGQEQYAMGGVGNGNGAGQSDFWEELSRTQQTLNEMQDAIQQVRQAHIASLSRLDTTPNSAAARETDMLISSTRDLTAHNKDKIKQLNKLAKDKAQKQQVQAIKSRFMSLLNEYQVVEKEFRKKVRERGERQFRIVKPDATPEEVKQVLETDNPQIFSQALLSSNRYGDARGAFKEVQERHEDIKKIEKTLTELAQMFNEMSMLVEQQDETINTIEN